MAQTIFRGGGTIANNTGENNLIVLAAERNLMCPQARNKKVFSNLKQIFLNKVILNLFVYLDNQ